jgi:hypothetical protein
MSYNCCIVELCCIVIRAFFNYITGGGQSPPSPHGGPPLNHFAPPPSQSPFSLKYKQNMEFRKEVWYSSNWNLLCESYVLSFIFNAKHCVVNTFNIRFYTFSSGLHIPDPIDLSCCKARLNTLVTAGGNGPPTQCFIGGGGGKILAPIKKTQLISKLEGFEIVFI